MWEVIRNFLFSQTNKEVLIFVFFLILAGIFWLNLALNETYEKEFSIPISVVGAPKNVVLTSSEVDTVKMTIRDKGFTLLTYMYGDILKKVNVNFRTYSKNNGSGSISSQDLQKMVYQQLASGSRITSVKPEKLEFFYNFGAKKLVPVRWSGRVIPEELFFISMVYTEQLNYANFRDTLIATCELNKIKGVKMVPDKVKVTFFTDVLTEEKIDGIPVQGINMPEGLILRTFPAKVSVSFVTGVSTFRQLKREDFKVIADYNEIKRHPSEKCHIYLKEVPSGISRTRLETTTVDYLVESESE